jgi:hypothetical protein
MVREDDGFRPVIPGSRNAEIENVVCGIEAAKQEQRRKEEAAAQCERAKHDDDLRVMLTPQDRVTADEKMCLFSLARDGLAQERSKFGVHKGMTVTEYLHRQGIFLECETDTGHN